MPAYKIPHAADEEQQLMATLWSPQYADDPYAFVMLVYPWGVENTPLAKRTGPRRWQARLLLKVKTVIAENKAVGRDFTAKQLMGLIAEYEEPAYKVYRCARSSGRGPGKSAIVSWLSHWFISTRIGSSTTISANTENQLRTVTWGEMSKWFAMAINAHWFDVAATKITPRSWLTEIVERELKKGTRYWAIEGKLWSEENPDGYAGIHNHDGMLLIFDEASGIPDSIWPIAEGFFTEPILDRYWFAFSNPRRSIGAFYECFHAQKEYWDAEIIDVRTVEGTDKAVYQQIIDKHGADSYQAHVEVYGEFPPQSEESFISPGLVRAAQERRPWGDPSAPIIMGIDPSRGGDSTVIVVRQGRDIIHLERFKIPDTMRVVGKIIEAIRRWKPQLTVMDEGGLGYGILDRLNEQGYRVHGVNFGEDAYNPTVYKNRRAEIWGEMKDWLATASIPDDRDLRIALCSPRSEPDSMGAIQLESKKHMKTRGLSSPDEADAIAVTFAYPVAAEVGRLKQPRFSVA